MNNRTAKFVPFLSALIGGVVVAAVLLAVGTGGSTGTTTVVQQAPLASASANAAQTQSSSLTPREIYKRDAPGVVFIRSQIVQRTQSPFDPFPQDQSGEATGSGIVLDKSGTILTNAHVIDNAVKVTVQFGDKTVVNAKVIGKDASDDIALLKVPTDGLTLTPLSLGDSNSVQVGDATIAIGNPFGLDRTLTTGVVSALQRQITAPNGFTIDNVIQTDAPINPGNSGGPLIDATGKVIGVNSQIETGGGQGSVGIGFAVPINTAKKIIPQLEKSGSVPQAYLGLTSLTIDGSLAQLNLPVKAGAMVQSVQAGSGAAKAGIRGGTVQATVPGGQITLGGDIVVAVDGKTISTSDDLGSAIGDKKPGEQVTLTIVRAGKRQDVKVTLSNRPSSVQNPNTPSGG